MIAEASRSGKGVDFHDVVIASAAKENWKVDPHPEEPRLGGVSKGEATSRAFILRDARSALLRMRD
jgi:hypothetical protein